MIIETKLVQKPAFLAIGLKESVQLLPDEKLSENAIAQLWDRFNEQKHEISDQVGMRGYGLIKQTPEMKSGDPFQYIAAVGVNKFNSLPEGMTEIEVPKSLYAVVTYRGTIDGLGEAFHYFWDTWLPQSKYQYVNSYEFEFYDQRYTTREDSDSEIDLYFPIIRK